MRSRGSETRPPAVAGRFYTGDPVRLRAEVSGLLARAGTAGEARHARWPKAVIVPHAGYAYSGPVAARAYAALRPARGRVSRVVLLGPAHYVRFRGIALPGAALFATPLGEVPLDRAALSALADLPQIVTDDEAHRPEHSLEVQLPFLQIALGLFRLVPLAVGEATGPEVAEVLERLWDGLETLIVVSSDLSHYHGFAAAKRRDERTAEIVERFEGAELDGEDACGYLPLRGLLAQAKRKGLSVQRLDLRNSGETAGPKDAVVGYGAWAFFEPEAAAR